MGDEEEAAPTYKYVGERAPGATSDVTAGEEPKVLTKAMELLGERQGEGEATFVNGDSFKGSFAGGSRHGSGKYVYAAPPPGEDEEPKPPVATYDGKWTNGAKSGIGIMNFASGVKYHGSFSAGKYEGQGTMYYANGDIYTGEWLAGRKHGQGTYFYKESGASVAGKWLKNTLVEGKLTDKFGNSYEGGFASTPTSAAYVPGGSFSLASGATDSLAVPGTPTWQTQYGAWSTMTCKSVDVTDDAIRLVSGKLAAQLKADASNTRCEMFGSFAKHPTPPYGTRPVPGSNDPKKIAWMELFSTKADYEAHLAGLKGTLTDTLFPLTPSGGAANFESLASEMYTLEKPGFGSGANHVIVICCQAKDEACAKALFEVAKFEIESNMVEPMFVRGTVIAPTPDEPLKVRWTVQWTSAAGPPAHQTFTHHKEAGGRIFPLISMAWGGGVEYDEAYHFAK